MNRNAELVKALWSDRLGGHGVKFTELERGGVWTDRDGREVMIVLDGPVYRLEMKVGGILAVKRCASKDGMAELLDVLYF